MSPTGTFRTWRLRLVMSVHRCQAEIICSLRVFRILTQSRLWILRRYSEVPADRRPLPARKELVHLLHPRSLYACTLLPCLSPCGEQTREHVVRSMNGCSAATIPVINTQPLRFRGP